MADLVVVLNDKDMRILGVALSHFQETLNESKWSHRADVRRDLERVSHKLCVSAEEFTKVQDEPPDKPEEA